MIFNLKCCNVLENGNTVEFRMEIGKLTSELFYCLINCSSIVLSNYKLYSQIDYFVKELLFEKRVFKDSFTFKTSVEHFI